MVSSLAGLSREALAAQRELVALRETLFQACREVALRAAEKEVGPGGDMASFVAEKAARKAVFAHLSDQRGGTNRVSTMLVTQLTENVIENKRSVFEFLTREQLMAFIEAFQIGAEQTSTALKQLSEPSPHGSGTTTSSDQSRHSTTKAQPNTA